MRVTVLGCGSSSGVPLIGCDCAVCTSKNPKNTRTRVSVFVEINGVNLLIDTSPDLRQQALLHNIRRVDAVLYTHAHADHTHGIDELRSFNYLSGKSMPVYGNAHTLEALEAHFPYVFMQKPEHVWVRPSLVPQVIAGGPVTKFTVENQEITAFEQVHGKGISLGYRIGNFAYSTDTDKLPEEAFVALEGVETWVVDCLRHSESYSHASLAKSLEWIARVQPKQAILTHMSHDFDYETLSAMLPAGIVPGYDGLVMEI